jgi:putative transposase
MVRRMKNYRKGSHRVYDLKYHIIWCPKYRYRVLEGEVANRTRELIREICQSNYVKIVKGHVRPDHVHILVSLPASISVSKFMHYVKGKSSRRLLSEFAHLRKKYWGQHLWARGYFAVTVGDLNEKEVSEYIENQDVEDKDDDFRISGG